MFVPEVYRPLDPAWSRELIRANPLATLVTLGPQGPLVTHLPAILRADGDGEDHSSADVADLTLFGHLNRANPHWRTLVDGTDATLVFHGPGCYVSPAVYQIEPAAPTWDFAVVHVHGRLTPIAGSAATLAVVRTTARLLEQRFGRGWDSTGSLEYFDDLLPGVGAFEVRVTSVDAMFKLSQEKEPEIRRRVRDAFAETDGPLHRELADLIDRAHRQLLLRGQT